MAFVEWTARGGPTAFFPFSLLTWRTIVPNLRHFLHAVVRQPHERHGLACLRNAPQAVATFLELFEHDTKIT
jgi:hypothetical protein